MNIFLTLKRSIKRSLTFFAGLFRPIEKKVVFESYNGRQYSDNPRAICEKMHSLFPDYKLVFGGSKSANIYAPDYVQIVDVNSWRYHVERATAVAFVRNEAMINDLYKRKGQVFIQTWHGDRGFKKILYDSLAARGISPKNYGFADEFLTDLFVLSSDYAESRIKTAFRYTGKVLKSGCPRNDCLVCPQNSDQVKAQIGIKDQKILLYAPTLRRNSKVVQAKVDLNETLKHFSQRGGDWVCLVRAHPKSLGLEVKSGINVIDVSQYPDMSDLLMIADALITDYSSCAGDFILRKKPLILAQFDLEQYMEEDRTFHVDINEIGYLIAHTQDELSSYIDKLSDEDFAQNCQKIMEYFGTHETGHASEDVCRFIDDHYQSNFR